MNRKPLRVIQVGVGGFGKRWVDVLKAHPAVKVVGLVDTKEEALAAARERGGHDPAICYRSLDEALSRAQADALVCVTPPHLHRTFAEAAMKAGLDVITEKPMADSLPNCLAMVKTAERTGRRCVVSQNYRYRPETWTLADLIRRGAIGQVGQVVVDFYMGVDFHGGFRHEMAHPLLLDMSIHHFDLIRFITGLDAVSVWSTEWNPPWSNYQGEASATVVFEMNNGARVIYNGSWCAKGQWCDWNGNWHIEGDKGVLVYQRGEIALHEAPALYAVSKVRKVKPRRLRRAGQDFVLDDFVKSVRTGARPQTDVRDNLKSIGMVFSAVQSIERGRKIAVPGVG